MAASGKLVPAVRLKDYTEWYGRVTRAAPVLFQSFRAMEPEELGRKTTTRAVPALFRRFRAATESQFDCSVSGVRNLWVVDFFFGRDGEAFVV